MQFPHIWTEIGKCQKLLGRLLAQPDLRSRGVKTAAWETARDGRTAASSGISRVGRKREQERVTPRGHYTFGFKEEPFQTPRRTELPLEEGKTAVQGREGRGHRFLIGLALPPTGSIPVRFLLSLEVIQPHCQLLRARRMASMGKWPVWQGG